MSESKRQIVIVSAVSVLIALSLGAGIYYYTPKPSGQSTTTVLENPASIYTDTPLNSTCGGYPAPSNTPVLITTTTQNRQSLKQVWRYVADGNNSLDLQVAVVILTPGLRGHLCVAYPIARLKGGSSESYSTPISFIPVAYNATRFTGAPLSGSTLQISANPSLVTFPSNSSGYLLVDYTLFSNTTGFYYYSLPYADYCQNLPLSVSSSSSENLSTANFDHILNNSLPPNNLGIPLEVFVGNCPGIPPPLTEGAIVSYSNLTISYLTELTGIQGSTASGSESGSPTLYSTITKTEFVTSSVSAKSTSLESTITIVTTSVTNSSG